MLVDSHYKEREMKRFNQKFGLLGWVILISLFVMGARISDNILRVGPTTGSDIEIQMGAGRLKWDSGASKMLFSNDGGSIEKEIGSGGGGGGGLNFFGTESDAENVNDVSNWNTGNNAVFDGGGTFAGTLSVSTTSTELIDGTKVYKWLGDSTAGNNDDDYVASPNIAIPIGYRGQALAFSGRYKWSGATGLMKIVVKDMTNTTILTEASVTLDQFDNADNTSGEFTVDFFTAGDTEDVRVGFQVITGEVDKILLFDNLIVTPDAFVNKNLLSTQVYHLEQDQNAMTNLAGEGEFNLGTATITNVGPLLLVAEDDSGNTRTKFIAQKNCTFIVSMSGQIDASGAGIGILLNGTSYQLANQATAANIGTHATATINMLAGDFITVGGLNGNGGLAGSFRNAAILSTLSITAITGQDHIIAYDSRTGNNSSIQVHTMTGTGSTDTRIVRFSTLVESTGLAITRASTAANGDTFTINEGGIYHISGSNVLSAQDGHGLSLNSSQLTTNLDAITTADRLMIAFTQGASLSDGFSWSGPLSIGDVIRVHLGNTITTANGERAHFTITKIASGRLLGVPKPQVAYIWFEGTATTDGGTYTSGSWNTPTMDTINGDSEFLTLASDQITLGAGTYNWDGSIQFFQTDISQIRLRNITDASTAIVGNKGTAAVADTTGRTLLLQGVFTITGTKVFEVQGRGQTTNAGDGFGRGAVDLGENSVFRIQKITKLR